MFVPIRLNLVFHEHRDKSLIHCRLYFLEKTILSINPFKFIFYLPAITEPPIVKNISSSRPRFSFCPSGRINCEPLLNYSMNNFYLLKHNIYLPSLIVLDQNSNMVIMNSFQVLNELIKSINNTHIVLETN